MTEAGAQEPARQPRPTARSSAGGTPAWERRYTRSLIVLDAGAVTIALGTAWLVLSEEPERSVLPSVEPVVAALLLGAVFVGLWLVTSALSGAFDMRYLGIGFEEYKRVCWAAVRVVAVVALAAFVTDLDVGVGFVAWVVGIGLVLQLGQRRAARKALHRLRASGQCNRRVLVFGGGQEVAELVDHLHAAPYAGLEVVALCVPTFDPIRRQAGTVPVVGDASDPYGSIVAADVDAVIIADSHTVGGEALRRLAWQLEGSGIELHRRSRGHPDRGTADRDPSHRRAPAPARRRTRATGGQRAAKAIFDRVGGAAARRAVAGVPRPRGHGARAGVGGALPTAQGRPPRT